jgi:type I restriction enzyme S subunit
MRLLKHWPHIKLSSVCSKIGSGATPRGGENVYLNEGTAIIRSQNVYNGYFMTEGLAYLTEEHAEQLRGVTVEPRDVLLNITGDSVARSCQVSEAVLPARVNQHVAIVRPNPNKLLPEFLCYYFVSPLMQKYLLSRAGSGGTRNVLDKRHD